MSRESRQSKPTRTNRSLSFAAGLSMALALSGCGNYLNVEAEGLSAVSRNAAGEYAFHVFSCEGYNVTGISLSGGFYDGLSGSNNPPLGEFIKNEPTSGYSVIDLSDPQGWQEQEQLTLPTEAEKYILADFTLDNTGSGLPLATEHYVPGTALTIGELQDLAPDTLVTDIEEGELQSYGSVEEFMAAGEAACES